jgi:hypothetical protein
MTQPKQHPILFNTEMVKAILEGRKTQTRRFVKGTVPLGNPDMTLKYCPYRVGDILYVRETWKPRYIKGGLRVFRVQYPKVHPWFYLVDGPGEEGYGRWKPSIHMPKEAARLFLKIIDIRWEYLNEISEEDAQAEGVERHQSEDGMIVFRDYGIPKNKHNWFDDGYEDATESFKTLINSIYEPDTWIDNPLLWVYEFEIMKEK